MPGLRSAAFFVASVGVIFTSAAANAEAPGCIVVDPGPLDAAQRHKLADLACSALSHRHAPAARYRISIVELDAGLDMRLASDAGSTRTTAADVDAIFVLVPELAQTFIERVTPPVAHDEPLAPDPEDARCATAHVRFEPPDKSGILYRIPHGATDGIAVCAGTCDATLPICDSYQIRTDGRSTEQFTLEAEDGGSVVVKGHGATSARTAGITLVSIGGTLSLLALTLVGAKSETSQQVGITMLGGGWLLAAGGVMAIVGGGSRVHQARMNDAFVRTPAWHADAITDEVKKTRAPFSLSVRF